MFDPVLI